MATSLLTITTLMLGAISKTARTQDKQFPKQSFLATRLVLGMLMAIAVQGANASAADAAKIVAALDTEYQAAVLRNDAATMDRILSDDFILVTGSGKVYTKADLLS